jgi:hypothetical protein
MLPRGLYFGTILEQDSYRISRDRKHLSYLALPSLGITYRNDQIIDLQGTFLSIFLSISI